MSSLPTGEPKMPTLDTRREPIRLSFEDGQVICTPKDQDKFLISASRAIEACSRSIRESERVSQFREHLLTPLGNWFLQNKSKVSACYVVAPESAVLPVYMVGVSEVYDFSLTEEFCDLTAKFEEQGWSIHISQIPLCDMEELSGYFNPDMALQFRA
jgi:hypothetical protein